MIHDSALYTFTIDIDVKNWQQSRVLQCVVPYKTSWKS